MAFTDHEHAAILFNDWIRAVCGTEFVNPFVHTMVMQRVMASDLDEEARSMLIALMQHLYIQANIEN